MTRRARSLLIVFGLSITMWVGIIHGAKTAYYAYLNIDPQTTASID